jgi:hypothetical protein
MIEPGKTIWTRHYSLPNPTRWILSFLSPQKLRRYLFRLLFCLACLGTIIALFYAEEDLRGKYAWESYKRQAKARGIELDWRAQIPPAVPDEQNFAMSPPFEGMFDYEHSTTNTFWRDTNVWSRIGRVSLRFAPPIAKLGDWVHGHPLDLKEWQGYFREIPDSKQSPRSNFGASDTETNYWPVPNQPQEPANDVLSALSKMDSDLAALREASTRPQSRFPIHYQEIPKAVILHLLFLGDVSRVLQLRAVAELVSGNQQDAFADANLAFYLADAIKSDAFPVSQVVRCHMMEGGLQPIWEGLRAHRWSEEQLKQFQRSFSKIDLLSRYGQWVNSDLAFACGWIESVPDDPSTLFLMYGEPSHRGFWTNATVVHILPRGWFYQNELAAARFFHDTFLADVAPQTQRAYPGLSRTNSALFDQLPKTPYNFAFKHLGRVFSPQGFVHAQTAINLALVACALERFRIAHGRFPENLVALAPEFLERMPHDIINGEPLKYRLTSAGRFILYSVGWNEKDDGGAYPVPDAPNLYSYQNLFKYHSETGDWVWQYPVSAP